MNGLGREGIYCYNKAGKENRSFCTGTEKTAGDLSITDHQPERRNDNFENITFERIKNDEIIREYIRRADRNLAAMGYTKHSFGHVTKVAEGAAEILTALGYDERTVELARIAGFLHDIGNVVNRADHAQSGAIMAFQLLTGMGMPAKEIGYVVSAIGHHDEGTAFPVNAIAAAVILADKSDVRRSRVRNKENTTFDIHDRVNYAVEKSSLILNRSARTISLILSIDTSICAVMDYFEIFLTRMMLSKRAAEYLDLSLKLEFFGTEFLCSPAPPITEKIPWRCRGIFLCPA